MGAEDKELLFERMPLPKAVLTLSIPTILTSLVMVIYNLADTYFVGMLSDPVQNAAAGFQRGQQPLRRGLLQHDEPCPGAEGL